MQNPSRHTLVLVAMSRAVNVASGGDLDDMLCSRAYRKQHTSTKWKYIRIALDYIFFWQPNHCQQCHDWEQVYDL